jgi:simple sugar transport system ATP-binding protein
VLYRGADILILDEPTGVLTPQESEELFRVVRGLQRDGKTIIFISHKLKEVLEISDRITVMRRGKVVGELITAKTNEQEIAREMVGRDVLLRVDKQPANPGPAVLAVENLTAISDRGVPALRGVSFELRRGEILGIAGVEGNGQSELVEVLAGTRRATGGRVLLQDNTLPTFPRTGAARDWFWAIALPTIWCWGASARRSSQFAGWSCACRRFLPGRGA